MLKVKVSRVLTEDPALIFIHGEAVGLPGEIPGESTIKQGFQACNFFSEAQGLLGIVQNVLCQAQGASPHPPQALP